MSIKHQRLLEMLTRLKLTAVRDRLDSLIDEGATKEMTLREFLYFLCEQETAAKEERRISMGLKIAKFPLARSLEGFDFGAQPSLDPQRIRELSVCRFVANGENVLFLGPPGVGKTHLVIALGREAVHQGYSTLFVQAAHLLASLKQAQEEGRLEERLRHFTKPKLLIIDELGYLPFEREVSHLFFQLVAKRYERGSMMITSNRAVSEWGDVFGDPVLATAILDRLLHHSHIVTIRGESYRLKEKRRSGLFQPRGETDVSAPSH
ncbi:AAA family ATPase [Lujinxingia vulgaris]|uniref:AAA family ATPase n=1 Tax=Lujinxingia vulgaris TaxID=2600176 RepID=A0A5C6XID5_9DELT|nr:IS21-like element helper ATPase IstB [Lujinxingia vulgaris]TXD37032.1 AAA family ATPase [Lujinxingia vulgaris]